jgi:hypothetical protein
MTASSSIASAASTPLHMNHHNARNLSDTNSSSSSNADNSTLTGNRRSIRLPLPSPSRPRLDPQYAARLAPPVRRLSSSGSSTGLVPPPGITRDMNDSIFRPTPIVSTTSPTTLFGDGCSPEGNNSFFLASPLHQSFRRTSSSSFGGGYYSSSSAGSSPRSYSRRSSNSSLSDIGVSDRFIPSRATSSFGGVNLWEGISSRRSSVGGRSQSNNNSHDHHHHRNHHHHHQHHHHQSHNSNANNVNNTADDTSGGVAGQTANADGSDPSAADGSASPNGRSNDGGASSQPNLLNVLLRSELLGENLNPFAAHYAQQHIGTNRTSVDVEPLREGGNHLHFQSPRQLYQSSILDDSTSFGPTAVVNAFSLTPVRSAASQRLMAAPQKRKRRISKVPFKVLDAPALQDDFYLNLVDWSSQNVLAVGLGSCVYLWSACTSKVTKLCDLAQSEDIVTSVSWAQRGTHLAVGTNRGEVLLWDTIKCKKVRTMAGHSARVGTLAWAGPVLASGSRDRLIYLRDVRVQASFTDRLAAHKQEVCGLKWSFDEPSFLASGGNDNQLHVVDSRNPTQPLQRFSDHTAAVKAIAWSPGQWWRDS